jgi:YD repeat-containing protein
VRRLWHPGHTYDANGFSKSRAEIDIATGASRTWAYTYTPGGLPDTLDGPRTDVPDITGHDAHGLPLTVVDPNGVTTTLSHDARGRLRSRSGVGARQVITMTTTANGITHVVADLITYLPLGPLGRPNDQNNVVRPLLLRPPLSGVPEGTDPLSVLLRTYPYPYPYRR